MFYAGSQKEDHSAAHSRRSGPGPGEAYRLASDDLDRWRTEKGDRAVADALKRAKDIPLYGDNLIDFIASTYPAKRRRFRGERFDRKGVMAVDARVAARGDGP